MTTTEVRQLTRMRTITTYTIVVTGALVGGITVATRPSSRSLWSATLLALIGGTPLLGLVNDPDSTVALVIGSLFYASLFIATFWLNDIAW